MLTVMVCCAACAGTSFVPLRDAAGTILGSQCSACGCDKAVIFTHEEGR